MNLVESYYNQILYKFYTGLKIYVDYVNGLPGNDGLTPQTPVDNIASALVVANNFGSLNKLIIVMRGNPSKKGDILDEPVVINVPNTAIDFNFVNMRLSMDGQTAVTLAQRWTGIFNANIDLFDQPTSGIGVDLGSESYTFVIDSQIQNCKTYGIYAPSGLLSLVIGNGISTNEKGIRIQEKGGLFIEGNVFTLNNTAILSNGADGLALFTRNIFTQNIIDVVDEQYYYTASDGVGSLNKLTSVSSSWTPGEYTGFLLIDSAGKGYKIVGNTATELNIVGVSLDGSPKDVIPADGNFWICHSVNDVFFYENYWDKLHNASSHIYGDSNEDGILDRLIQMPEQGIGVGKSSSIDIRPLTLQAVFGSGSVIDFNAQFLNQLGGMYFKHKRVDATVDIPDRNIVAGMVERIEFKVGSKTVQVLFKYDSAKRDILEIYDVNII